MWFFESALQMYSKNFAAPQTFLLSITYDDVWLAENK